MLHPRALGAALALALALTATSCGKTPESPTNTPTPQSSRGVTPGNDTHPTDPPTAPPEGTEFTFDQSARYDDGVSVEVATIRSAKVTGTQTGAEGTAGNVVIAEVLVTNKSQAPFVTDAMVVHGYYAGVGAPKITDTSGAVGDSFKGTVPPGGQAKAVFGFAIPSDQLDDVTVVVDGGDDAHGPLQFKGKVDKG